MPRTYRDLSIPEYRAAVRSGPYVFPGGGEQYYLCSDGGILCHRCAYTERRQIISAMRDGDDTGWRVVAVGNTYNEEPTARLCDHCGEEIGRSASPYVDGADRSWEEDAGYDGPGNYEACYLTLYYKGQPVASASLSGIVDADDGYRASVVASLAAEAARGAGLSLHVVGRRVVDVP